MSSESITSNLREYPLPIAASVLIVVFGVLLFLRGDRIQTFESDLNTSRSALNRSENNIREAVNLEADKERLTALAERVDRRLMVREEVALNLDYFYRLEASHEIRIESLRPLGGVAGPVGVVPEVNLFDVLGFDLTVRGDFPKINEFIRTLEADQYFSRVESVTITRPTGDGANVVAAQISLNILGRKP